ncbi:methyl-accepting chemotaxis protein, partial [Rhizobium ruizarguesonis]
GSMAAAGEVFRQPAIANNRRQIDADENRKQADDDRRAAQQKAESDATERLRFATSGLASGLRRLAAVDLAFRLDEPFAPDF